VEGSPQQSITRAVSICQRPLLSIKSAHPLVRHETSHQQSPCPQHFEVARSKGWAPCHFKRRGRLELLEECVWIFPQYLNLPCQGGGNLPIDMILAARHGTPIAGCNGHIERKCLVQVLPVNAESRFCARSPFDDLPKRRGRLRSLVAVLTECHAPDTIPSSFG